MRHDRLKLLLYALATGACSESVTEQEIGDVVLTMVTTGGDVDLDGYVLVIDDAISVPVPLSGSLPIRALSLGTHVFELDGIAANCRTLTGNRRTVHLSQGDPTRMEFRVTCVATGFRISAQVQGADPDPSFGIVVNGVRSTAFLEANDSLEVTRLTPGQYSLSLGDVASNCTSEPVSGTVTVTAGEVVPVAFVVSCLALTGAIQVRVVTGGQDLDQGGVTVNIAGFGSLPMESNGVSVIEGLFPGPHVLRLSAVARNCEVVGSLDRSVVVTAGHPTRDTSFVEFGIVCARLWGLAMVRGANIMLASADGDVFDTAMEGTRPDWSPDGRRLAYECFGSVCIVDLDSPGRIMVPSSFISEGPSWEPAGTRLVFTALRCDYSYYYDYGCVFEGLMIVTAAGTGMTRVALPPSVALAGEAAWSPDGNTIVFACRLGASAFNNLCRVRPDGTEFERITTSDGFDGGPAWKPDGSKIAFSTTRFGSTEIAVMNPDGTGLTRLSPPAVGSSPTWTRDGTRILYTSVTGQLTLVNPDGSGSVRFSSLPNLTYAKWRP